MQPISPQPITSSPQGAASIAPIQAPTPTAIPQAPAIAPTPAPVATPNFDTQGTMNDIANYYQIPRGTAQIVGQGQAQGAVAQQQFEAQKAQNDIKSKQAQDALDPSKYIFQKNTDGSVTILNSLGDKVDIGTYAGLTGDNPASALQKAGASDEADQKFIAAYNNFQNYAQTQIAAQHGDETAQAQLGDYYKANPGLQNMELGQLQSAFMQQYGQYFGQSSNPSKYNQLGNAPNVSPPLTSANNPITTSGYENPNFQTEFSANQYQQSSANNPLASLSGLLQQQQGQ